MLLTPQPESSNAASAVKSGMRARRRMHTERLMRYLPMIRLKARHRYRAMIGLSLLLLGGFALRFRELIVVFLRANRVGHRERCQRIVKGVAFSHVSREHNWIG